MRLRCSIALGLALMLALGCHDATPPKTSASSETNDSAADAPLDTKLEQGGCSVMVPGKWTMLAASGGADGSWSAERTDGDEGVTVLPTPWKAPKLESEWREDLAALMDLRRESETGDGISVSEAEYVGNGQDPGAFYTSVAAPDGQGAITIAKASPTLLCLFVFVEPMTEHAKLAQRARALLPAAHAAEQP
jgi:hypothetical protein